MNKDELIKEKESILKDAKRIIQRDIVKLSLKIYDMEFNEYLEKVNTILRDFGFYAEYLEEKIKDLQVETEKKEKD